MSFVPSTSAFSASALALAIPTIYGIAALLATLVHRQAPRWLMAQAAGTTAVALAATLLWTTLGSRGAAATEILEPWVRADGIGVAVLALVTFLGWVILRYSMRYLAEDPAERRAVPALLAALACVTLVLTSNHLLVLSLAWFGTSLALHQLLTLYSERPAALIAAHKKFIASRLADVALVGALWLTHAALGTWRIDEIAARVAALPALPVELESAALLFVLTALLKCAQLPFHGWLIQVMEAPTPVSALLHAGIVNLGGFVLIRLSELIGFSPVAQTLLVAAGGGSAILATLIASTRISVKVALAWSTCAQMGFMLMQIGLGLYELALLHLLAHSLYKAHAFLSAGGAVEQARIRGLAPQVHPEGIAGVMFAAAVAIGIVLLGHALWPWHSALSPGLWVVTFIAGLAFTPLFAPHRASRVVAYLRAALGGLLVAGVYVTLHELATVVFTIPDARTAPAALPWLAAAGFAILFLAQHWFAARPAGALATWLHPWFYSGFYLDELFTRLTFRVWPARLPRPCSVAQFHPIAAEGDAR